MKVLVIGSGGREHALAWKLAQSPAVEEVLVAPGNAGLMHEACIRNAPVAATDIEGLVQLVRREQVALTVVGPEAPLALGVVNAFRTAGLRCFGPTREAAQIESSKAFAKDFLRDHRIPTADYAVFSELASALAYVRKRGTPIVIKADGLASGKGVVVATSQAEAEAALHNMLGNGSLGEAGARVVVEDFLEGEEVSFMALCDGKHALPLASSQDHKRRDDGDRGPNTGGMGAYSPAPVMTESVEAQVMSRIIRPTLAGLAEAGMPFTGFLYAGLMVSPDGTARVVEFNARLGDPETQPLLLRLDSDLVQLIELALDGRLDEGHVAWDPRPALGVVLAAHGYPAEVRTGDEISGLDFPLPPDVKLFHAGTCLSEDGRIVSCGGRVLTACALGETLSVAREAAYAALSHVRLDGSFCRHDIGFRALHR